MLTHTVNDKAHCEAEVLGDCAEIRGSDNLRKSLKLATTQSKM